MLGSDVFGGPPQPEPMMDTNGHLSVSYDYGLEVSSAR